VKKSKIAESIIIRVGGGIRAVRREPVEIKDVVEPVVEAEPDFEQSEDVHSFRPDDELSPTITKEKIIN
jgi:hypothetical protein